MPEGANADHLAYVLTARPSSGGLNNDLPNKALQGVL